MLTQLQAVGYEVKDLDWVRDKLEIPSLAKMDPSAMMGGMPGAPGAAPMSEAKTPAQMADASNGAMGAFGADQSDLLTLFDFSEFDEDNDLLDKTKKDRVSRLIAAKFDGTLDDVGYERIISDTGLSEASMAKIRLDEYTSPGEIAFGARRLIEEIKRATHIEVNDNFIKTEVEQALATIENSIRVEDITPECVEDLIELYKKAYRLNRRVIHNECVVVDRRKAGYWAFFAPYFM